MVDKKILSAILGGRHIEFSVTSFYFLYSSQQILSFDTHIMGLQKKYPVRHLWEAAILDLE